jgi:mono/diheme cytochrome c family protein
MSPTVPRSLNISRNILLLVLLSALTNTTLSAAEAAENWKEYCMRCHGADGKGATKTGRKLKIRDLTLEKTQRRITDAEMAALIAEGYNDNDGSERMPAFAAKLTEPERLALVAYVRAMAAPKSASTAGKE